MHTMRQALLLVGLHFGLVWSLSEDLCQSPSVQWVSASPRLQGTFPYYDLLFSCSGDLNIEGKGIDSCLGRGAACGQPAAAALCTYLGFDGASAFSVVPADAPVRSLTGEWCLAPGAYEDLGALNRTAYDALLASQGPGPHCQKLDSISCYRSRPSLKQALARIQAAEALAPAPAPLRAPPTAPKPAESPSSEEGTQPAAIDTLGQRSYKPSRGGLTSLAAMPLGAGTGRRRILFIE